MISHDSLVNLSWYYGLILYLREWIGKLLAMKIQIMSIIPEKKCRQGPEITVAVLQKLENQFNPHHLTNSIKKTTKLQEIQGQKLGFGITHKEIRISTQLI